MELGLRDKCALVTGASEGLGKAIAEELASEGAHIAICARGKEKLEATANELRRHGVRVEAIRADASDSAEIDRVIHATLGSLGRIDVLVNNVGTAWVDHTLESSDEEWHESIEINFHSTLRFTRGVVPTMREQGGGRIINIATLSAHTPIQLFPDYNSAKAAMLAFSKSISFELAADNILVNCVCPAFIHTPLWDSIADGMVPAMGKDREEVFSNLTAQFIALKRFGHVREVSGLVAFLASDRASFMTGGVYDIDGGVTKSI